MGGMQIIFQLRDPEIQFAVPSKKHVTFLMLARLISEISFPQYPNAYSHVGRISQIQELRARQELVQKSILNIAGAELARQHQEPAQTRETGPQGLPIS